MVAAWGDFHLGLIHHDIVSAMPGVRTEHSCPETIAPLLRGLFERWIEQGRKPYLLGAGESGFLLADSGLQCALGDALQGMRSSLVHGISDERGRHDCLYVIFSANEEPGDATRDAMEVLLPYLDAALRQVAHLPRQHRTAPSPVAPPKNGDEHGMSEREIEIINWVKKGKTNQEIGSILDISAFTVKNHLQRIFKKLDVYNRTQAVAKFEKSLANGRS
jgi:transcriptional regulator EpsA